MVIPLYWKKLAILGAIASLHAQLGVCISQRTADIDAIANKVVTKFDQRPIS
jgi:hypothetical protein